MCFSWFKFSRKMWVLENYNRPINHKEAKEYIVILGKKSTTNIISMLFEQITYHRFIQVPQALGPKAYE